MDLGDGNERDMVAVCQRLEPMNMKGFARAVSVACSGIEVGEFRKQAGL